MPDLTDEDYAAIRACIGDNPPIDPERVEDAYCAGLAAGRARAIEECAKVCESEMNEAASNDETFPNGYELADAIRALLK